MRAKAERFRRPEHGGGPWVWLLDGGVAEVIDVRRLMSCDFSSPQDGRKEWIYRFETGSGRARESAAGSSCARRAASAGGTAAGVLCAADEEAVKCYLDGKIKFTDIPKIIEKVLSRHKNVTGREPAIYDILESDRWAREETRKICYR